MFDDYDGWHKQPDKNTSSVLWLLTFLFCLFVFVSLNNFSVQVCSLLIYSVLLFIINSSCDLFKVCFLMPRLAEMKGRLNLT